MSAPASDRPDTGSATGEPTAPPLRVELGNPSAEELGVLVALLAGLGGGAGPEPTRQGSRWSSPDVRLRSVGPGGGAWRFSGMPL